MGDLSGSLKPEGPRTVVVAAPTLSWASTHQLQLRRVLARWARYDLIALDEVGYVPMADVGAEFLFQVVAKRAEKAAVLMTTNLPFSEWTQVIPNVGCARRCWIG